MSETSPSENLEEEPKIEIKEYSDEFKEQVIKLVNDAYEKEGHRSKSGRPDLEKIPEIYQEPGGNFWVAVDGEKVIGTFALINEGENRGSCHRFCIDEKFRGRMVVASELYANLLKFAKDNGYKKLFSSTWAPTNASSKLALRKGFKRIESLPEDISKRPHFLGEDILYELDLEDEK